MLKALRQWMGEVGHDPSAVSEHDQRLAVAVLLLEVARADFDLDGVELDQLRVSLQRHWHLSEAQLVQLLKQAEAEVDGLTSLHAPIRIINSEFSPEQKADLIESLWEIAFADDEVDAHEEHLIRRLSEMLHVPHQAFIARKQRARGC